MLMQSAVMKTYRIGMGQKRLNRSPHISLWMPVLQPMLLHKAAATQVLLQDDSNCSAHGKPCNLGCCR
jgi:hypothetical protein